MGWSTAADILNDAAVELGLTVTRYDDPFAQQDQAMVQLCQFLKTGGREIVDEHNWSHLRGEFVFTTSAPWSGNAAVTDGTNGTPITFITNGGNLYKCVTAGTTNDPGHGSGPSGTGATIADNTAVWAYVSAAMQAYPLPADWRDMMDQTGWNRTNRLPLGGPLSPQEWQFLKSRLAGVVFTVLFRPMLQKLWLYPDTGTPQGQTISMEYESSNWAGATGTSSPTKDSCSVGTDIVFFDAKMMLAKVKLDWLSAKGFDVGSPEDVNSPAGKYKKAFDAAKSNDIAAPVLSLSRGSMTTLDPLLSEKNIPITGFGS